MIIVRARWQLCDRRYASGRAAGNVATMLFDSGPGGAVAPAVRCRNAVFTNVTEPV